MCGTVVPSNALYAAAGVGLVSEVATGAAAPAGVGVAILPWVLDRLLPRMLTELPRRAWCSGHHLSQVTWADERWSDSASNPTSALIATTAAALKLPGPIAVP